MSVADREGILSFKLAEVGSQLTCLGDDLLKLFVFNRFRCARFQRLDVIDLVQKSSELFDLLSVLVRDPVGFLYQGLARVGICKQMLEHTGCLHIQGKCQDKRHYEGHQVRAFAEHL